LESQLDTEKFLTLGERLATLLNDESQPLARTWDSLDGSKTTTRELGDAAWWCVKFSFLRNKLMHGSRVVRED
jgi:hypothetical protein